MFYVFRPNDLLKLNVTFLRIFIALIIWSNSILHHTLSKFHACLLEGLLQLRAAGTLFIQRCLHIAVLQGHRGHNRHRGCLGLTLGCQRCQQVLPTPATKDALHTKQSQSEPPRPIDLLLYAKNHPNHNLTLS